MELLRDLFDLTISVGTIHRQRLQATADKASAINVSQDLSLIRVGHSTKSSRALNRGLAGVDATSTYCYLLAGAEHRDEDTWGWHLLDAIQQGLDPEYTIADAAA